MKRGVLTVFVLFLCIGFTFAQTADEIVEAAKSKAKVENKNVFLIFHASWCGWCKKFDKGLDSSRVKLFFDANYVKIHLTVKESEKNKKLETVGGEKYLKKFDGEESGLPFWVILDSEGEMLASSIVNGENLGCPADKLEVEGFIQILNKTVKNMAVNENDIKEVFIIR